MVDISLVDCLVIRYTMTPCCKLPLLADCKSLDELANHESTHVHVTLYPAVIAVLLLVNHVMIVIAFIFDVS